MKESRLLLRWQISLMLKPVQRAVAEPSTLRQTGDCATGAGSMTWPFRVSISSCWKKWTCPTVEGKTAELMFEALRRYVIIAVAIYYIVYAFFIHFCHLSVSASITSIDIYCICPSSHLFIHHFVFNMLLLLFPPRPEATRPLVELPQKPTQVIALWTSLGKQTWPWRGHWWLVFPFQGWLFEDCQKLMGSSNSPEELAILFWHSGSDTQWLVHFWGGSS